jgi:hypothetical protein
VVTSMQEALRIELVQGIGGTSRRT